MLGQSAAETDHRDDATPHSDHFKHWQAAVVVNNIPQMKEAFQ